MGLPREALNFGLSELISFAWYLFELVEKALRAAPVPLGPWPAGQVNRHKELDVRLSKFPKNV